jgi:hypothetical protein
MSVTRTKSSVDRGWIRHSPRYPAKEQIAAIEGAGVKLHYSTTDNDTLADLFRGLMRGDHLYVLGTHRLGATRAEYAESLEECRRKRITIHDLERGEVIDAATLGAASAMVADDLREIMGELRGAGGKLERKRKNYSTSGRKLASGAMSKADARRVWEDTSVTVVEAQALTGWHRTTLARKFPHVSRPNRRRNRRPEE